MENEKIRGYVVSHTHWDREWYLTFQEYRIRLIKVLDMVIRNLKEEPEFKHFMLDGQTSALEDYLEVRRNVVKEIRELVARGKLLIGPWFTQPDEALASSEALVRNLLIGHRIAEQFGHVMKVGYLPDTFGHIAQMPQILRGFNIDNVVFMRGLGDEGEKLGFEFIWKAPSEDRVVAIHLINGYCNANMIGAKIASYSAQIWEAPINWKSVFLDLYYSEPDVDTKEAIERLEYMKNNILPTTKSKILLLMNGCDHMPPQRGITEVIREANNSGRFELKHGTLEEYISEVKKFQDKMLEYEGELRGARFHPLLVSSISSRMYLKQMNYQAQAILEKYAEPLATIAKMYGFEYPAILLLEAWKEILRNHAHDSIYGTGIDPLHKENETRFLKAIEIGTNVAYDSIRFLSNLLYFEEDKYAVTKLLVFNPHPYYLTEKVSTFLPIEKGSYKCIDEKGNETKAIAENQESYWITGSKLEFVAENIPPMGFKLFRVYNANSKVEKSSEGPFVIENEYFKVFADPKKGGILKVEDKETGRIIDNLNVFVDDGDVGDEYNYSPPKELDNIVTSEESEANIEVIRSDVKQSFLIKVVMKIPKCAEGQKRSSELVEIPVNILVDLLRGKRRIDVKVELENVAEDHRLRVKFNSGLKTEYSYADSQFYVQKRSIKPVSEGKNWVELPPTTHPQLFWVNVNDGEYG
ncbi:MAG: glycoside hydrolase family 38 C-terminal domain-containing protein, partial [Thermoproteota archaeon]